MATKLRQALDKTLKFSTYADIITFHDLSYGEKVKLIDVGISKEQLENIKIATELTYSQLAHATGFTERVFHQRVNNDLFSPVLSDLIFQIVYIYGFGYRAFMEPKIFNKWMFYGCPETKYSPPYLHLNTCIGRDEVRREILRVKNISLEGVYEYLAELPAIPMQPLRL